MIQLFLLVCLFSSLGDSLVLPGIPIIDYSSFYSNVNQSTSVSLPSPVKLGADNELTAFIYENGLISFGEEFIGNSTGNFPLKDKKIVAPLWRRVDSTLSISASQMRYSLLTANSTSTANSDVFEKVEQFLWKSLNLSYSNPEWILVIQWIDVCLFGKCKHENDQQKNSFQAIITTDGVTSLAIFTYQCGNLSYPKPTLTGGYSINNVSYRQYPLDNVTNDRLACASSNFSSLVFQLSYGLPVITTAPSNTIGQVGESITFHCAVVAVPPVIGDIVWKRNNMPISKISSSHRFSTQTDGDITRNTLTISHLSTIDSKNRYHCMVSNAIGTIESQSGTLIVNHPVVITSIPTSINRRERSLAVVTCSAFGIPFPTITWIGPNGGALNSDVDPSISVMQQPLQGQNILVSILTISSLKHTDSGTYNCTAGNKAHGDSKPLDTDVRTFTVTVESVPKLKHITPIHIFANVGDTVTIELYVEWAEPPITNYEWSFSNNSGSSFATVACNGITVSCSLFSNVLSLVVVNASLLVEGRYRIQATNDIGTTIKEVSVTIVDHVNLLSPPFVSKVLNESDQLVIQCIATGLPSPDISWTREPSTDSLPLNHSITTSEPVLQTSTGVYRVESTLLVPSIVLADQGIYICTALNTLPNGGLLSIDRSFVTVQVQTLPILTSQSSTAMALLNQSVTLGVVIIRDNPPVRLSDITWTFNGSAISTPSARYEFTEDKRTLTISSLTRKDHGVYTIIVSNAAGQATTQVFLSVLGPTNISVSNDTIIVKEYSTTVLECIGRGYPLPIIHWRRQGDQEDLPTEDGASEVITSVINAGDSQLQYVQSLLVLYNVTAAADKYNEVYVCHGTNNITNHLSTPENATIRLTISVVPVLSILGPKKRSIILYRNVPLPITTLTFMIERGTVDGVDLRFTPSNVFSNVNTPISVTNSSKYVVQLINNQVSLTIQRTEYTDQGRYMLSVQNEAGLTQLSIDLAVYVETEISVSGPKVIEVDEHDNVTITCIADGVPRPKNIVWFRNATLIDPMLFRKVDTTLLLTVMGFRNKKYEGIQSTLTIRNVNRHSDRGLYTCRADNGIGEPAILEEARQLDILRAPSLDLCTTLQPCQNEGTCVDTDSSYYCLCTFDYTGINCEKDVVFEVSPEIIKPPQSTVGELYSQLSLSCEVTGTPTPRVAWFKDGKQIEDGNFNVNEFTIDELGLKERGFYHCTATSRINGEMIKIKSDVAVINIRGVVQYRAHLVVDANSTDNSLPTLNDRESTQQLVDEINEFVAGSIIQGDSSLFFIELLDTKADENNSNPQKDLLYAFPIVITIVNSDGGSDELLQAVQNGLSNIGSIGIETNFSFLVTDRHDGCRPEITKIPSSMGDPDLEVRIDWPEVNIGEEAIVRCPCGQGVDLGSGSLRARRFCGGSFTSGAQWQNESVRLCNFSDRAREICNLANLPASDRISKLGKITENELAATEVSVAASVLLTARNDSLGNTNLTESFLGVIDNINNVSTQILRESLEQANTSARLLESVEELSENVRIPETESSITISKETFTVTVQSLNTTYIRNGGKMYGYSDEEDSSVYIPQEVLDLAAATNGNDSFQPSIILSTYRTTGLFLRREESVLQINSRIVSAAIGRMSVNNLSEPVVITINPNTMNNTRQGCYYWDPSLDDGFGEWSQKNCKSTNTSDGRIVCSCNHLTNFAVLLDVSPEPVMDDNRVVGQALNAVSYIGVILSIVCLLVTIVTYLASRKLRRSEHGKLLLNLCFALLGLYVSYILAIHGTSVPAVCAVISVTLQYFLLVTFFVMATEAVNLYMKLVIVLGKGITRYYFKATIISWTCPIFIVVFCFAPSYKYYIGDHFCRVYDIPFYIGVIVPFVVIYLFNWALFVIIMFQLLKKRCQAKYKESVSNKQKMSFKQQFMIALTLSLLFGLGWGIGLLATQSLYTVTAIRDLFAALFILLTSFQGLFIFLMHCARSREVRKQWVLWVYKAVGKEVSSTMTNSISQYSARRTIRNQDSITSGTYLTCSGTLKEYVKKSIKDSFDEDQITGYPLDTLADLEKKLEAEDKLDDLKDDQTYPVPSDIRLSKAVSPDFNISSSYRFSLTSIGSGGDKNFENPFLINGEDQEGQRKVSINRRSLILSTSTSDANKQEDADCSNLPNPMLDSDTLSGVLHD